MAENAGGAVTQQPRSKKKELEEFVRDLDPLQVQGLSASTTCTAQKRNVKRRTAYTYLPSPPSFSNVRQKFGVICAWF